MIRPIAGCEISRREFIGAASVLITGLAMPGVKQNADQFDVLRERWRRLLVGDATTFAAVRARRAALGRLAHDLKQDITFDKPALWADLPFTDPLGVLVSYQRLRTMALAWASPDTGVTGSPELAVVVANGAEYLYTHAYNESTPAASIPPYRLVIGIPQTLLDVLMLMGSSIPRAQAERYAHVIEHFDDASQEGHGFALSSGANRVDQCQVFALLGIVTRNPRRLELARDGLSPTFAYGTDTIPSLTALQTLRSSPDAPSRLSLISQLERSEGFHRDGSYLFHVAQPYQGGYGVVLLRGLANLLALLVGSPWEVRDPAVVHVFDAVTRSFAPVVYNGLCMDAFSGRGVSRGISALDLARVHQDDHTRGHAISLGILRLADAAPRQLAHEWRRMVKGWMERESWGSIADDPALSAPELELVLRLRGDRSIADAAEPVNHVLLPDSDRAIHRRRDWAACISMCSARIMYFESGNGENLHAWHTAAGMLYWWPRAHDNGQFSDDFWPTVDPYRLPGITVSSKPLTTAEEGNFAYPTPNAVWVGGATDGEFATVGQMLEGFHSTLTAKKSWFCLDEAIVCLGSGIHCADGEAVESVVENRNLGAMGGAALTIDGHEQLHSRGDKIFEQTRWAAIRGYGAYVFLEDTRLSARRELRTGSWHDINKNSSAAPVAREYLTLCIDHGRDPRDAHYAYALMPNADAATAAARAAKPRIHVLANDGAQQAIAVPSLGLTMVNFWSAGAVDGITVDRPCAVLLRESDGHATLVVADPTRTSESVSLDIARPYRFVSGARSVVVSADHMTTHVRVAVGGSRGASHRSTLARI